MYDPWLILFLLFGFLIFLTGLDHMVTGVLAEGLPPDGTFQSYALWVTGLVFFVGMAFANSAPTPRLQLLHFVSVLWTWVGGSLDFLYFMMRGEIPAYNKVWTWIPGNPTTAKWALWAFGTLVALITVWATVFYYPGFWGV